jgi:hypothetical protein
MNNRDSELLRKMMQSTSYAMYANIVAEMQKTETRKLMSEMFENGKLSRWYWEHHPSINTDVTDKDMFLLHIDMALDNGDAELFKLLRDELRVDYEKLALFEAVAGLESRLEQVEGGRE